MISTIDIVIAIGYVLLIVSTGLWSGTRKKKEAGASAGEYFLAGKSLRWPMIGLALFATNISCLHLVSLAQSGFDTGLLNGNFEWMAAFTLVLLAVLFIPFYIRSNVTTLPDFLERRYNSACRDWLAFVSIITAIIIHIAFSFLAGGIVLETLFGINMYVSIIVIAVLTGLYTIIGGLKAVVITESIQSIVLIAGAIIITIFAWNRVGGWEPMKAVLERNYALDKLSMLRPAGDASGMSWMAVFLGYPVLGIWYWCADQTIVQRALGAKDENHAKAGALFCGFIKILPVFIFVLPGLFAYVLYHTGAMDLSSLQQTGDGASLNTKGIYTLMITQLLPKGLVGILVAALLSGLMSQIAGALNSIATLSSYDLYKRIKPHTPDEKLVTVGRWSAGLALLLSIGLLPLLNQYQSLFEGINDVIAHIAPPITCVFLVGVFWKKASPKSAQLTLWLGSLLGAAVFAVNKLAGSKTVIGQIPFMMMTFYLFCTCVLMQVVFSYVYPVQPSRQSERLYWKTPWEPLQVKGWSGIGNYKTLSALLILIMAVLYWFFR